MDFGGKDVDYFVVVGEVGGLDDECVSMLEWFDIYGGLLYFVINIVCINSDSERFFSWRVGGGLFLFMC